MQRHDRDARALRRASTSITSDDVSRNEPWSEVAHRTDKFLEIVETTGSVGRPLGLPHVDISTLLENMLRQFLVRDLVRVPPPPIEVLAEALAGSGAKRFQLLRLDEDARGALIETPARRPYSCKVAASLAEPAFRLIIDALEGKIVIGLRNASKIGQRVASVRPAA